MQVVLDTNVLVSALLKRDSIPGRLLQAFWDGTLDLVSSEPLLAELREVLNYPKLRKRLVTLQMKWCSRRSWRARRNGWCPAARICSCWPIGSRSSLRRHSWHGS
jgi:predicted nucleic acid-binding protein